MASAFSDQDPPERRIADGLAKLGQALRSHAWHDGLARKLTPTQGEILAHLSVHEGASLQQVAASLSIRAATASEAVRVLANKGWVSKSRSLADGRTLSLRLTTEGRQLASQTARWPELLAETVGELDGESQQVLLSSVMTMIRRLQERGAISVARICVTCRHFRRDAHEDVAAPHHCALVNAAFGDMDLRVDCPDHLSLSQSASGEDSINREI